MKADEKTIAPRIGVAVKTLQNWRVSGAGPDFYKIGSRILYDEDEVDDWIAKRRCRSTSDSPPSATHKATPRKRLPQQRLRLRGPSRKTA